MESAYYAQFPGSPIFKARPGDISTRDLAAMASLDNFPTGYGDRIKEKRSGIFISIEIRYVDDFGGAPEKRFRYVYDWRNVRDAKSSMYTYAERDPSSDA